MSLQRTPWIVSLALTGTLCLVVAPAFGQIKKKEVIRQRVPVPAAEVQAVVPGPAGPVQVNRLSTVLKSKILIQQNQPAGTVVDFVLSDGGCIEYIVADYQDQYYVIPYGAVNIRYPDSVVFVDIAPPQFRQVQFFAPNRWPNLTAPTYQNQVFATFNVNVNGNGPNRNNTRDANRNNKNRDADTPARSARSNKAGQSTTRDADQPAGKNAKNANNRADDPADDQPADNEKPAIKSDDAAPPTSKKPAPPAANSDDEKPAPPATNDDDEKPAPKADDDDQPEEKPQPKEDDKPAPPASTPEK